MTVFIAIAAVLIIALWRRFPPAVFTTAFWEAPQARSGSGALLVIEMGSDDSFPQLWRSVGSFALRHWGGELRVLHYRRAGAAAIDQISPAAVVLTGYHQDLATYDLNEMAPLFCFLRETGLPVFGICGGFQFLCMAFGSHIVDMGFREKGHVKIELAAQDVLFSGLPPEPEVYNWHRLMVDRVPDDFVLLARNNACIQAVRHHGRPVYGVQFHPEFSGRGKPHGTMVFKNFLELAARSAAERAETGL